ncbi:hypothetical protein CcaverHIS002_0704020 [Cutaneotrichosporon cavernicola]|uniref:Ig-like domain-containing protein n=1 Tax=Cutaneotrichosporon cavernicola TaxID=279322 RepID=A0AA48QZ08_9TREE|nr:uncharacterized protein CcaverHIS019_0704110 [Cutaneotrichosporon cavernicola]BEI87056.1 hypothetical protein CcaverHIS002_0704020 [Cutaneotrichosporon cavernicola]BEI94830.1 hypothetical protein CcaverHIS019_0704110 [Cutaneotrichosporon cavernicola]
MLTHRSLRTPLKSARTLSVSAITRRDKTHSTSQKILPCRVQIKPASARIGRFMSTEMKSVPSVRPRSLPSFSTEGKVCVVTGAARGLGNMMASSLIESGASQLVILDLNGGEAQKAADELAASFGDAEIEALGLACDVSNESSVQEAFATIEAKFGRVDILVTAAGIVENFHADQYPTNRVKKLLDVNVMGTWFCAREAARLMPVGGSQVLIGSMSGSIVNVPQPQTPYNFSKAAVRQMARSLAVEWAGRGIRVNCISPGYMLTALTKAILDKDPVLRETWVSKIPQGRMGDPSDLKGALVYLASDASKYTTGSELVVDGGYTCV